MTCPRGAASPNAHTQRRLFSSSGGYCQNPACSRELFIEFAEKGIHVAEMAHVFAANDDGPRANARLSKEDRGNFDNLVLLCSTCHTIVDKAPETFTDGDLLSWKREHANKLRAVFGVTRFESRSEAQGSIAPYMRENRAIFDEYGPLIEAASNPESGAAERWGRKVLTKIIPNNRRVLAQLAENQHLLTPEEVRVAELFRQHVDDLEARHIEGFLEGAAQFPPGMTDILKD